MADAVVIAEDIGKKYTLHQKMHDNSLRGALTHAIGAPRRWLSRAGGAKSTDEFWALKAVSFELHRGEVLGVIGRNGAGKSTLLKILSRITAPTTGSIRMRGHVASLLEVGTGFHPELTGRENIFLNGAILGMHKVDIARKFDSIVAFAEIERFVDTPVKRYSSGMYVRLAFAVAAHLEPEILVIDEVLAVGDMRFQQKCLGKLDDVAKQGRTILFVSHNLALVAKLCTRAILLDQGSVIAQGDTGEILRTYVQSGEAAERSTRLPPPRDADAPGFATEVAVLDSAGQSALAIPVGKAWQARVRFTLTRKVIDLVVGLGLKTIEDVPLRTAWSKPCTLTPGDYEAVFREDLLVLGADRYALTIGLSAGARAFHYVEDAAALNVVEYAEGVDLIATVRSGYILNPMRVDISPVSESR